MQQTQRKSHSSSSVDTMYVTEMTAQTYKPIIGRDAEIQKLVEILSRKNKPNPILLGDPGVGKTALVEGLSNLINEGVVPSSLRNKKIYSVDLSLLGSDLTVMKYVLDEIIEGDHILFIDEIHNIVGAGQTTGSLDLANVMKPLLTSGSLRCIGATTLDEYMRYFEKDSALERRFSKLTLEEPDFETCLTMLKSSKESYEKHHNVTISLEALEASISLSKKYIADRFLPDKAFDVLDEACAHKSISLGELLNVKAQMEECERLADWERYSELKYQELPKYEGCDLLEVSDIENTLSKKTGIPMNKLKEDDVQKLKNIEDHLRKSVVGQDEALRLISDLIKTSRVGIKNSNISALLLGPSGVGKTEVAKAVAEFLFGNRDHLVRFDMSEFSEKHSISKLIGSPAGYVGYDDGGQLTEAIRRKPYSVILFDEVEKAHPEVYDTLLQVLDEGRLTDSKGREVDFSNTVILMTSNLSKDNLCNFFRVEFINRIDEVIQFSSLSKENLVKITHLKLEQLSNKLKQENNIFVDFTSTLVSKIVNQAFKPEFGARELERVIHRCVKLPLTEKILNGEVNEGELLILD